MGGTDFDGDDAEKPLDPAAERLRRKMVRLLAVSMGAMFIAVMTVLGAVVYKIGPGAASKVVAAPVVLELAAGARIEAMAMDAGIALLHVREGERVSLVRLDLASGRIVGRYEVP